MSAATTPRSPPTKSPIRPILAGAFLRAVATGMVSVLLGLYLAQIGFGEETLGVMSSLGLGGIVLAAAYVTFRGERLGRRRLLILLALLAAGGGAVFALGSSALVLAAAALVGMVNAAGRDRGAASILEQSLLADSVEPERRTNLFARYNVAQDAGRALGSLMAGLPDLLRGSLGETGAMRAGMMTPALLFAVAAIVALSIPARVDANRPARSPLLPRLSPASRPLVARISALFFIDSFGGGLLTTALVSYWFFLRFGVGAGTIGLLTAATGVLNAISHLGAAWLAKRIGLVNTMVFTHLPSSLLFMAAAFAPTFPIAATLYLLREGLAEMDVPTRQSYVLAIVKPEERTVVAGVTSLVRMAAWAVAPWISGIAMKHVGLATPLVFGSAIKIVYDLLLWRACRHVRPPEEQ